MRKEERSDLFRRLKDSSSEGKEDDVKTLLGMGVSPNEIQDGGHSPLILAADSGHEGIVKLLLSHGANVNYENDMGDTPLNCAIASGNPLLVSMIIEAGAQLNIKNRFGVPPIRYSQGNQRIANILVNAGAHEEG